MKDDIRPPVNNQPEPTTTSKPDTANTPQDQVQSNPNSTSLASQDTQINDVAQKSTSSDPSAEALDPSTKTDPNSKLSDSKVTNTVLKKPKKNMNFPVFFAVLILIGLCSIVVYSTISSKDKPSSSDNSQNTSSSNNQATQTSDNKKNIEDTIEQIDSLPEDTDKSGEGLSDQNLGL